MTWTEERVAELIRLWETGKSASEIGRILGVSKNSVVGKAHRLKLKSRPSPIRRDGSVPKPRSKVVRESLRTVLRRRGKGPGCLWPIGDPGEADFHFCGAEAVAGKPYCSEHCARAYITKPRGETQAA